MQSFLANWNTLSIAEFKREDKQQRSLYTWLWLPIGWCSWNSLHTVKTKTTLYLVSNANLRSSLYCLFYIHQHYTSNDVGGLNEIQILESCYEYLGYLNEGLTMIGIASVLRYWCVFCIHCKLKTFPSWLLTMINKIGTFAAVLSLRDARKSICRLRRLFFISHSVTLNSQERC